MEENRDRFGLIKIDELVIKNIHRIEALDTISFIYKNKKYYYKSIKGINQLYNELIGEELANDFGFNNASYDLASYEDTIGVVSKDFMNDNYIYLKEYLSKYYGDTNKKYNYKDVCYMFLDLYGDKALMLLDDLFYLIMFDIIIANADRHSNNIIIYKEALRLGILFDNEMLLDDSAIYDNNYGFSYDNSNDGIISYINVLDKKQLSLFRRKIEIISDDNIIDIINRVEKIIKSNMIDEIKEKIVYKFHNYYIYLLNIYDNRMKENMTWKLKK